MGTPTYAALLKVWLIYAGIGVLFGAILYYMGGDTTFPLALGTFAIFALIGTILVFTALWGMLRRRQRSQGTSSRAE